MDRVYKACSDATRRKILKLLRDRDMTAGEIAAHFEVTKPTLSKHFGVLREAGLVQDTRSGRNVTYHLNASVLENALLSLMEDYDFVWTPSGDIASVARELVDSLVRGDFVAVTQEFDSEMAARLTPEKLKEAWDLSVEQFGPFVKQLNTRTERFWKYTAVIVTCEFAKSMLDIKVTFIRSGRISGLFIVKTE
jgi:ArsR family transcriptional regulator, arsenate/arsenite/antimonite-responsive transcriptional repressor